MPERTGTSVLAPVHVLAAVQQHLDLQRYRAGEVTVGIPTGVWLNLSLVAVGGVTILVLQRRGPGLPR